MFTTEHLDLRAYCESDRHNLLRLFNDPQVQRGITNQYIVPRGPKEVERLEEGVYRAILYAVITVKDTDEFVGQCSVSMTNPKNRDGIFGISILPRFWNKGYGTETTRFIVDYGFRSLALHRMSLQVFEGNGAAVSVYKKIGFVEEGRARKVNWVDGEWEDLFSMGILEDEWAALRQSSLT